MRVDILSKEYPPAIYGGAGVHVAELVRALRERGDIDVQVRCFGDAREETGTSAYADLPELARANPAMQTLGVDVSMAGDCVGADLVHSHTWYANMAGHLASLLGGMPHVVTAHSLEPMRPWKAEQLGGGYRVSSWAERTAYEAAAAVVAVSAGMRRGTSSKSLSLSLDPARVHVVHNGIDSRLWWRAGSTDATDIRATVTASTPTRGRSSSSGGSPVRRACPTCCGRAPSSAAGRAARARAPVRGHPRDPRRGRGTS